MVDARVIPREGLDALIASLRDIGFTVIGPTISDGAIVYDVLDSTDQMPEGWGDLQNGGEYRLLNQGNGALFGYNLGPDSWKRLLFPPKIELLHIRRNGSQLTFEEPAFETGAMAFFGIRSCEIAAMEIQDRVFLGSGHVDPAYAAGRSNLFLVAVNCGTSAATCFCTSMGTGPECRTGFDLVITELAERSPPEYLISAGSERGEETLAELDGRRAESVDVETARGIVANTAENMARSMETDGVRELLIDNPDHPRWEMVAARCLMCGNCTQACPTCFCSDTTDTVTLDGDAIRWRTWDSCFGLDFSAIHGQPVRESASSRYRQWMTHKLATWHDQFGTSGCVGCGRCITWCPVGIDITEEVAAMRERTHV